MALALRRNHGRAVALAGASRNSGLHIYGVLADGPKVLNCQGVDNPPRRLGAATVRRLLLWPNVTPTLLLQLH
jgi:hypothetical protein